MSTLQADDEGCSLQKGEQLVTVSVSSLREEKKKKQQKPDGCDGDGKTDVSSGGTVLDQGSKGGGGPSQQPLKRGQKVRQI